MNKLILTLITLLVLSSGAAAQASFSVANSATGTSLNTLTKFVLNGSTTNAQIAATTDTANVVGITTAGNGTTGVAVVTYSGIAPCVFDNATTANDYVQISATTAGNCHDVGATRPATGQIIGRMVGTGGAAGTYNVSLDKDIYPSASVTAPICALTSTTDSITAAGSFATTCPVPASAISGVGQVLHIVAHGILTTTATASPVIKIRVNAGGTTGLCTNTQTSDALGTSVTNGVWDLECHIVIVSTGAPGTAIAWGRQFETNAAGGAQAASPRAYVNASTVSYTTNSSQTVSIEETATLVAGQSFTLHSLVVTNY